MGDGKYSKEEEWEPKTVDGDKLIKWLEEQKKSVYDPENTGVSLDDAMSNGELDEGQQTEVRTYDELIAHIKKM